MPLTWTSCGLGQGVRGSVAFTWPDREATDAAYVGLPCELGQDVRTAKAWRWRTIALVGAN